MLKCPRQHRTGVEKTARIKSEHIINWKNGIGITATVTIPHTLTTNQNESMAEEPDWKRLVDRLNKVFKKPGDEPEVEALRVAVGRAPAAHIALALTQPPQPALSRRLSRTWWAFLYFYGLHHL